MKAFFNVIKTIFLCVGVVIGAGFVTGKELLTFFGKYNLPLVLFITFLLFFIGFYIVFALAKKHGTLSKINQEILGKGGKVFYYATLISSFILTCSMLAGLDELFYVFFSYKGFPVLSLIVVVIGNLTINKGVNWLEKLSLILVPVILVFINVFCLIKGEFSFQTKALSIGQGVGSFIKGLLYVCMNIFMSLPVLVATSKKNTKKQNVISAIAISLVLCVQALIILGAVAFYGQEAINSSMPLLVVMSKSGGVAFFATSLFFALVTSVFSSCYPIYVHCKSKGKPKFTFIITICALLLSRIGLSYVIQYLYPVIAVIGVIYLCICLRYFAKSFMNKKLTNAKNTNKLFCWRKIMKSKKKNKNKVIKLTDEEYNNYIMALKDEKPPKLIQEAQDMDD